MNIIALFDQLQLPRSAFETFKWWEKKRLLYNLLIGLSGLFLLFLLSFFRKGIFFILVPALLYGCVANVLYTFGFIAELGMRKLLPAQTLKPGPVLLFLGTLVSLMTNAICALLLVLS